MVQINFAQKQVNAKIVYYGPGMSGKTTNLEIIHQRAPKANRGELTSISTDGDRTLFFDFMPLDLGTVAGMRTCFQIYTVPGQVYYNSTRKLVLQGVDGVIFVADSSASMLEENLESMKNLEANLAEYGRSIEDIPLVIQYNKRDLGDAMPVEDLDARLNPWHVPAFEGIAHTGQGVFPTLKALAARVIENIHSQQRSAVSPAGASAATFGGAAVDEGEPVAVAPGAGESVLSQTAFNEPVSPAARPAAALRPQPEARPARRTAISPPDAEQVRARAAAETRSNGRNADAAAPPAEREAQPAAQPAAQGGGKLRLATQSRERAPAGARPQRAAAAAPPAARKSSEPLLKRPDPSASMKLASKRGATNASAPPPAPRRAPAQPAPPSAPAAPPRRTPRPMPAGKKGNRSAILTGIIVVASIGIGAFLGSLVLSLL